MEVINTKLEGVRIIIPKVFGDHRGYFMETYSEKVFHELGIDCVFVQDNQSFTQKKGTLRGIHFQNNDMAQAKLVRVTRGKVFDVAVDLRKGSPTYREWVGVELSEENKKMFFIPRGFGHGFVTLCNNVEFLYKVDNLYSPKEDRGIRYDDPDININWDIDNPILSEKDISNPYLKDSDCSFKYREI